ncbi:hypothetical protein DFP73DRAFT_561270 [Morchella snyderi]|nr:hypothetical protein DFP73DRAFT_561270 [Morchella snyderi]
MGDDNTTEQAKKKKSKWNVPYSKMSRGGFRLQGSKYQRSSDFHHASHTALFQTADWTKSAFTQRKGDRRGRFLNWRYGGIRCFVLVVEAKTVSLGEARKQCFLSLKDMRDNNGGGSVYGFITTGDSWRMVSYDGTFQMSEKMEVLFDTMDDDKRDG